MGTRGAVMVRDDPRPCKRPYMAYTNDNDQAGESQLSEMQSLGLLDQAKSEADVLSNADDGWDGSYKVDERQCDHTNEQDAGPPTIGPRVARLQANEYWCSIAWRVTKGLLGCFLLGLGLYYFYVNWIEDGRHSQPTAPTGGELCVVERYTGPFKTTTIPCDERTQNQSQHNVSWGWDLTVKYHTSPDNGNVFHVTKQLKSIALSMTTKQGGEKVMLFGDSSTADHDCTGRHCGRINKINDFDPMDWVELHDESRRSYFFLIALWAPKVTPNLFFYPSFLYDGRPGCPEDVPYGTYANEWLLVNSTDHAIKSDSC